MTDNEIMNIDEAIEHAREAANRKYAEGMLCHANPNDDLLDGCIDCAKEHEQLAKWLEELKACRKTIKRQKAEIERLQKHNSVVARKHYDDGIKEFADRLKAYAKELHIGDNISWLVLGVGRVDQLIKEMTEESE